jgi:soluble lytic murein transglycosylase-like protein
MRSVTLMIGLLLSLECSGLELVHLKNGFTLDADSHTTDGDSVVLQVGTGTLTLTQSEIENFESVPQPPAPPQVKRQEEPDPVKVLAEAAQAYGVDPAFVQSVARIESGLRQRAISPKGAVGLMQLMPATAAELRVDASEAGANASGGARYLRELLLRYKGDSVLALAAYNAGPGAVQRYKGAPPYEETRRYILKVLQEYKRQLAAKATADTVGKKSAAKASKPSATD